MMTHGLRMMQSNDAADGDKWAKGISRRQLLLMALLLLFDSVACLLTTEIMNWCSQWYDAKIVMCNPNSRAYVTILFALKSQQYW